MAFKNPVKKNKQYNCKILGELLKRMKLGKKSSKKIKYSVEFGEAR